MAISGIVPADNYPPGCQGSPETFVSDKVADLRRMLAPLAELPEVDLLLILPSEPAGGSRTSVLEEVTEMPSALIAAVMLELDPDCPHLDFAFALQRLLHRLQIRSGWRG